MSAVRVRPARPDEAAILAEMADDLNDHVGIHGRPFTPERICADAFGPRAAFTSLVAELDGAGGLRLLTTLASPARLTDAVLRARTELISTASR